MNLLAGPVVASQKRGWLQPAGCSTWEDCRSLHAVGVGCHEEGGLRTDYLPGRVQEIWKGTMKITTQYHKKKTP